MYRQIAALAATTTLVAAGSASAASESQLRANARALEPSWARSVRRSAQ